MKIQKLISKTKIKLDAKRKTNPETSGALRFALKSKSWLPVAKLISSPTRKYSKINLSDIDKKTTAGDTVLVVGKVLGSGDVSKRIRIAAFGFSKSAVEKLKKAKSEYVSISEEIKKNPKAEGLKILK
jgi:large subunit ribosomal protein L18e